MRQRHLCGSMPLNVAKWLSCTKRCVLLCYLILMTPGVPDRGKSTMVSAGAVNTLSVTSLAAWILPWPSASLLPLLLVLLLSVLPELLADS